MWTEKVFKAFRYADAAHEGQKRKYTGQDYIVHPMQVAHAVALAGGDENMQCAALLHDVIEDCNKTYAEIYELFGQEVAELVSWLTDKSKPEDGNRKFRKAIDRRHIGSACLKAKCIKLCDLINNTEDIVANDKDFARVYLKEKKLILDELSGSSATDSDMNAMFDMLYSKAVLTLFAGYDKLLEDAEVK